MPDSLNKGSGINSRQVNRIVARTIGKNQPVIRRNILSVKLQPVPPGPNQRRVNRNRKLRKIVRAAIESDAIQHAYHWIGIKLVRGLPYAQVVVMVGKCYLQVDSHCRGRFEVDEESADVVYADLFV